jgi:hypothetical protein
MERVKDGTSALWVVSPGFVGRSVYACLQDVVLFRRDDEKLEPLARLTNVHFSTHFSIFDPPFYRTVRDVWPFSEFEWSSCDCNVDFSCQSGKCGFTLLVRQG